VAQAEKILIVGGGPVGIEIAGEIATDYPDKKVTLVHNGNKLLSSTFPDSFRDKLLNSLRVLNVEVILGEKVSEDTTTTKKKKKSKSRKQEKKEEEGTEDLKEALKIVPKLERRSFQTTTGKEIQADLVFHCVGAKVNNEPLKKNFSHLLDVYGRLKVNPNLQVEGFRNIFALGDITNLPELKMAVNIHKHVPVVANNIQLLDAGKGKKLNSYKSPSRQMIGLSMGRNGGAAYFGYFSVGNMAMKYLKSRTMGAPQAWKMMNAIPQSQ